MLDVSRSSSKKQIRTSKISDSIVYRLSSQTEKQSTDTGLPTSRCKKKGPFTIKHYVNDVKNHVGCLSKSIKKADQASKKSVFIVLAGQMRNSQHLRGYQQANSIKKRHSQ